LSQASSGTSSSRRIYPILAVLVLVAAAAAYHITHQSGGVERPPLPGWLLGNARRAIAVRSPAFPEGGPIPARYTCDGADTSPPLEWSTPPAGAKALLVLVYDPDAPNGFFIHWLPYDAPPSLTRLPEALPPLPSTRYGLQAVNDFRRVGYGGPCPPPGRGHRYVFLVAALDEQLRLPPGLPARRVLEAARGHVIAYGYTWGVYARQTR
jgi:Raf kinase inhibitor-like YbhB/YbcL family protein